MRRVKINGRRRAALTSLSPRRPAHHHINLSALASGTDQPLAPIEHWSVGATAKCILGAIRVAQGFARFQSPRDSWDEPHLTVNNLAEATPALIGRLHANVA
jgi:hypothetical protein